jgi:hypothetical protein
MIWMDDYHDHYVVPSNQEELEEIIEPLLLLKKGEKRWEDMYATIQKCIEIFGYHISLYFDEYMKYGDHIEDFLYGFWVNLREAEYNEEGSIEFENTTVFIENGFMLIRC